jgi:transcriptional regulator with XRE-family HTH domain
LDDLLAAGDAKEVVPQGEYLELRTMLGKLKNYRERQGLSLTDVANRCGMDRSAISRLENGVYLNPTVDTLCRYAQAVGADIGFNVRVS